MRLSEALDIFEENIDEIEFAVKDNWAYALSLIEKPKPTGNYNLYWVKANVYLLKCEEIRKQFQPTLRLIALRKQPITSPDRITDADIERAKQYPLGNLLPEPPVRNMTKCPLHNDKSPSFHVRKDNTWICYGGCGSGDSIDLYQKLNNTSFLEAVRKLQI